MVIVLRILPQVVTRELARGPGLVERMAKQIVFGDARLELLEEFERDSLRPPERNNIRGAGQCGNRQGWNSVLGIGSDIVRGRGYESVRFGE